VTAHALEWLEKAKYLFVVYLEVSSVERSSSLLFGLEPGADGLLPLGELVKVI